MTYDGEADAGFLYLPYASPASVERDPALLEYSHSIEDDSATLGLSADNGLVRVRFPCQSDAILAAGSSVRFPAQKPQSYILA